MAKKKEKSLLLPPDVAGFSRLKKEFLKQEPREKGSGQIPLTPVEELRLKQGLGFTPIPTKRPGAEEAGLKFIGEREQLASRLIERGLSVQQAQEEARRQIEQRQLIGPEQEFAERQTVAERLTEQGTRGALETTERLLSDIETPEEARKLAGKLESPGELFDTPVERLTAAGVVIGGTVIAASGVGAAVLGGALKIKSILGIVGFGIGKALFGKRSEVASINEEFQSSKARINFIKAKARSGELSPSDAINAYNLELINIRQQNRGLKKLSSGLIGNALSDALTERTAVLEYLRSEREANQLNIGIVSDITTGQLARVGVR